MRAIRPYRRAARRRRRARAGTPTRAGPAAGSTVDEHRDLAVVEDLGGLAAEEQALDPAIAVRGHDDEVAATGLGDADDRLVDRVVELAYRLAGDAKRGRLLRDLVEDPGRGFAHELVVLGGIVEEGRRYFAGDRRLVGGLDIERRHLRAEVARHAQAGLDRLFGQ